MHFEKSLDLGRTFWARLPAVETIQNVKIIKSRLRWNPGVQVIIRTVTL